MAVVAVVEREGGFVSRYPEVDGPFRTCFHHPLVCHDVDHEASGLRQQHFVACLSDGEDFRLLDTHFMATRTVPPVCDILQPAEA